MSAAGHAYRAVIFDMDGILIDSEPLFRMAAQRAAGNLGHELRDEVYMMWMGLPPRSLAAAVRESMGPHFPLDAFHDQFRRIWTEHTAVHGVAPQPGMPGLLAALRARGVPLGVATSTQRDQALRSLELAGLGACFDVLIAGDEVEHGKPAPEIYLRAAAAIGVPAPHCVALEDSAVGVRSAAAAGMLTIMVPDLHQPEPDIAALARYVLPTTVQAAQVVLALFEAADAARRSP